MDDKGPRERLLDGAIDYVAQHGLSDVSLRTLAAALGTSHRMLIHHFGSKERLWVEIVSTVEERQRGLLAEILPDPEQPIAEAMRAWWKHISDPALWPNERLFFEIYGQALQGRRHTVELLDGIVDYWLDPVTEINMSLGIPRRAARATPGSEWPSPGDCSWIYWPLVTWRPSTTRWRRSSTCTRRGSSSPSVSRLGSRPGPAAQTPPRGQRRPG